MLRKLLLAGVSSSSTFTTVAIKLGTRSKMAATADVGPRRRRRRRRRPGPLPTLADTLDKVAVCCQNQTMLKSKEVDSDFLFFRRSEQRRRRLSAAEPINDHVCEPSHHPIRVLQNLLVPLGSEGLLGSVPSRNRVVTPAPPSCGFPPLLYLQEVQE